MEQLRLAHMGVLLRSTVVYLRGVPILPNYCLSAPPQGCNAQFSASYEAIDHEHGESSGAYVVLDCVCVVL